LGEDKEIGTPFQDAWLTKTVIAIHHLLIG
jgi:hypothetical protein